MGTCAHFRCRDWFPDESDQIVRSFKILISVEVEVGVEVAVEVKVETPVGIKKGVSVAGGPGGGNQFDNLT